MCIEKLCNQFYIYFTNSTFRKSLELNVSNYWNVKHQRTSFESQTAGRCRPLKLHSVGFDFIEGHCDLVAQQILSSELQVASICCRASSPSCLWMCSLHNELNQSGDQPDFSLLIATARRTAPESSLPACIISRRTEGFLSLSKLNVNDTEAQGAAVTRGAHFAYWHSPHRRLQSWPSHTQAIHLPSHGCLSVAEQRLSSPVFGRRQRHEL